MQPYLASNEPERKEMEGIVGGREGGSENVVVDARYSN